ncbi:hypothetical protein V8G54_005769 [Vigna mungo]|uniref:Uncharacterized protein n=1 Tax=Vigna mungo TaxID=3915 RepID=A0AAQ3P0P2_VIGMU
MLTSLVPFLLLPLTYVMSQVLSTLLFAPPTLLALLLGFLIHVSQIMYLVLFNFSPLIMTLILLLSNSLMVIMSLLHTLALFNFLLTYSSLMSFIFLRSLVTSFLSLDLFLQYHVKLFLLLLIVLYKM